MIAPVMPTYARSPLAFDYGEGAWLIDQNGDRYLDFGAGIAVCALGHTHPKLVAALEAQARRLWHVSNLYTLPEQEKLAQTLVANSFADTVFFTNSGAEAIECAIKTARRFHYVQGNPQRNRLITFKGSFHGRTLATIAATGAKKLTEGFAPLLDGFDSVEFENLAAVKAAITPQTAGILLEPIQGEGGIRPASAAMLQAYRGLCDEHGILLIYDEIQCGMGRTGHLFAHQSVENAVPDILASAKGIGGGFPLGACLATQHASQGMIAGTHGSTYGGNPLACAVGSAVLEEILSAGFLEQIQRNANNLTAQLERLVKAYPQILKAVRGQGLMLGLACHIPVMDLVHACRDAKLLTVPAADNVLRLLPPLNIEQSHIDTAMNKLEEACKALSKTPASKEAT